MVDSDLEKFFDRVNHDKLMGRSMKRENDLALRPVPLEPQQGHSVAVIRLIRRRRQGVLA